MNGKQSRGIRKAIASEQIKNPIERSKRIKYLKACVNKGLLTFSMWARSISRPEKKVKEKEGVL